MLQQQFWRQWVLIQTRICENTHHTLNVRRPSNLLFEIIGSVDYLEMSERRRARRKFLLQESPTSHIATSHEASSLEAGRSFLKFGCMKRLKNEQWTNFKILRNCKGGQVTLIDLFLSRMDPEDPPNRKKDPKIQKISQNPKNQNNSENVSLKIRPCRPWKLGPLFSHEAVFSTN